MNKLICCTSDISVGCTFMDWSIHFLSGQTEFYNISQGWIPLSSNPISKINAHGHQKNHPSGLDESKKTIQALLKENRLVSYYPWALRFSEAAENLGINAQNMTSTEWQLMNDYRANDYNQLLKFSESCQAKVIFVSLGDSLSIYANTVRVFDSFLFTQDATPTSSQDIYDEKDSVFFKDSVEVWNKLGLTNKWDTRERLALSWPFDQIQNYKIDFSFDHYWLDSQAWWYDGKQQIKNIMDWLKLTINPDRFAQWIPMYEDWQQIQFKILKFIFDYKHIVECIVNNWSYPIDLTFEQEVIIQRCLIYQHGLNFKTWQLEKFPNNTKDLHQLLEPNIHPLT
jgi:hypothetical protein